MRVKYRKGLKTGLAIAMLAVVVYITFSFRGSKQKDISIASRADGEQIVFYTYNKKNQKVLEITCTETQKEGKNRTVMKNIIALIYKKGRMNKDIRVFGDRGYVEGADSHFFIERNARIESEDFSIKSKNFTLKGKVHLVAPHQVDYKTKGLTGVADKGMEMFLKKNILNFSNTHGKYFKDNKEFDYATDLLWVFDETKSLVMEKNSSMRDKNSLLRSDWITIQFDKDFKKVKESSAQKNSYLYIEDPERRQIREVKAEHIGSIYNEDGKMTRLVVMKNAEILMKDKENHILIASESVDLYFDAPTGKATEMDIPMAGRVENTGKTKFDVAADKINAKFDGEGEIRYCTGEGNVHYVVEDYRGTTHKIVYNVAKDLINLTGDNSKLETKSNTFHSDSFKVRVKDKILSSQSKTEVKTIIHLEKKSVLFSAASVFINAREFVIYEKENRLNYEKNVTLNQGDTVLRCRRLQITDENQIAATGSVSLNFKSEGKEVELKAEEVTFKPAEKSIELSGNAAIKNDENLLQATRISILFNDDNEVAQITGDGMVNFSKEELSGTSDQVKWLFKEDVMILSGSPIIRRTGGTSTTGKELKINLETGEITILSGTAGRTETIIRQ